MKWVRGGDHWYTSQKEEQDHRLMDRITIKRNPRGDLDLPQTRLLVPHTRGRRQSIVHPATDRCRVNFDYLDKRGILMPE